MLSSTSTVYCVVTQRCHLAIIGFKKKAKKENLVLELSMAIEKLNERVDPRAEERELKRTQLEAELLKKQQDKEKEHEMHMQDDAVIYAANDVNPDWLKPRVSITCTFTPPITEYPNTSGNN